MRNLFALSLLTFAAPGFAQPSVSPEVHGDGRVTFRLRAPNAREVVVRCEGIKPLPMQKDERGVWSVTAGPMGPDFYAYSFSVDGLRAIDPANSLLKYNLLNTDSLLHMPGPSELPWEVSRVPHGVLHRHLYHSGALNEERPFIVYTPPGYDSADKKRYPVLYLLHGYSDAEDAWTATGRAHVILDNLIARGEAKPMLVVMPLGYGNHEVIDNGWQGLGQPGVFADSNAKFRDILVREIIPRVQMDYRVKGDRKARAVAGLSMGGTQSLLIGLNALDRFAWIGAFSSGGLNENFYEAYPEVNAETNGRLSLLWMACGKDDGLLGINKKLVEWFRSKGLEATWTESPGGHSFRVWRRYLADFLPLLFQEKP